MIDDWWLMILVRDSRRKRDYDWRTYSKECLLVVIPSLRGESALGSIYHCRFLASSEWQLWTSSFMHRRQSSKWNDRQLQHLCFLYTIIYTIVLNLSRLVYTNLKSKIQNSKVRLAVHPAIKFGRRVSFWFWTLSFGFAAGRTLPQSLFSAILCSVYSPPGLL